ncbi:MAG: OmpA family protein [Acidimicrobiia bacterium]|nr:MAG: OmpA family protein [Acidimicrobiia bacterium]
MTIEVADRRRRRGGVLLVLILAVIAAWLVYLWLDGIGGGADVDADAPTSTTVATQPSTTTTTVAPMTTTTTVAATTTTTAPPETELDAAIAEIRSMEIERFGTRFGEPDRFAALFATPGEPALGLSRIDNGNVLLLARLAAQGDLDRLGASCRDSFVGECGSAFEANAETDASWLDGVLASFGELGDVRVLGIGVVGGEYTLLGQVASEGAKERIGSAVAGAIAPDLTLVNDLEVVDEGVITDATERGLEDLDLAGITFESGSADITAEGQAILDEAVSVLTNAIGVTVEVGGHTDSAGGAASNQRLSQARAEAVVAYLADGGVDETILTAVGYGEQQPIADNATPEGREQNRRIEFTVSAK